MHFYNYKHEKIFLFLDIDLTIESDYIVSISVVIREGIITKLSIVSLIG